MTNPTTQRLQKLLAYHESIVVALRTTLALLDGRPASTAKPASNGHGARLQQALALDAARTTQKKAVGRPKQTKYDKATRLARRQQTMTLLQELDRTEPRRPSNPKAVAVMLRHGYIKKKGNGYVLTSREFTV